MVPELIIFAQFRSSYYGQADGAKAGAAAAISIYSYIADVLNIKELDASIIPPQIMISIFLDIAVRANQLLEDQLIVDVDYFYTFVAGFNSVYTFVQMIDVQNHFLQAKFTGNTTQRTAIQPDTDPCHSQSLLSFIQGIRNVCSYS